MLMIKTNNFEIGIDEAGRGPLFGRVYAAAVIWDESKDNDIIKDSKKLSSKQRLSANEWIKNNLVYSIGYADNNEIDEINILEATKLAINRALENLNINNDYKLLIDGCGWENKFNYLTKSIVKGDSKYYAIAAASILAKVAHDTYIEELCNIEPELNTKYYLLNNMGYGTKKHIEGIRTHGHSIYHRKSFKIKNL